jgi:putative toxin-antitoxin system antitoxin component (TIGR02293 family)
MCHMASPALKQTRASAAPAATSGLPRETAELLGGRRILHDEVTSEVEAHRLVLEGLPAGAMAGLVASLSAMTFASVLSALGVSQRSFARRKASPKTRLPSDESARLWQLAGIVAQATRVFGSKEEAELWLERSAAPLGNEKPIDLIRTPPGVQLVKQYLTRIEYGVYT